MKQETERLDLIPMSLDDLKIFHNTNIDSQVREYLWDNQIIPKDISCDILGEVEKLFEEEGWGLWKILTKEDGAYIGYVGLWKFFGEQQPQLLHAIFKKYTGNGYATEAAESMISYSFEKLGYEYLVASMDADNESSIHLCKRIGLSFREERKIDGKLTHFYQIDSTRRT